LLDNSQIEGKAVASEERLYDSFTINDLEKLRELALEEHKNFDIWHFYLEKMKK